MHESTSQPVNQQDDREPNRDCETEPLWNRTGPNRDKCGTEPHRIAWEPRRNRTGTARGTEPQTAGTVAGRGEIGKGPSKPGPFLAGTVETVNRRNRET